MGPLNAAFNGSSMEERSKEISQRGENSTLFIDVVANEVGNLLEIGDIVKDCRKQERMVHNPRLVREIFF